MAARTKNRGKALLRRSTSRQEMSLAQQLDWAIGKAREVKVKLDATQADLEYMQRAGLHRYKDLYVDDAITGADLTRPGLSALRTDAMADRSVSHLFIYLPDRFARPEEPFEAALMEIELRKAGMTIEFSNRTAAPRQRGVNDFADNVQLLYQYTEAGQYLQNLAQRVIEGQVNCAQVGGWTGGRAPYGFARVLVDAGGQIVQELIDGMRIRKEGCRVRVKPKDANKIRVWLMILEWYHTEKIGSKRIAQRLNHLKIPSPDAGRSRTDNGVKHKVSGKWNARTVLTLIRNRAIIDVGRYGVQSEGKYRRLGERGPRVLEDADILNGTPKVVQNPISIVISGQIGFGPTADLELFNACQEQLDARGKSQRRISRRSDPARYPLALRVWDMSNGCGHPMYALTSGNRALYKCGLYMKTSGARCKHNAIDGEAALKFALSSLTEQTEKLGGREALRKCLLKLAAKEDSSNTANEEQQELRRAEQRLAAANADLELIGRNLARASDEAESEIIRSEWRNQKAEVVRVQQEIGRMRSRMNTPSMFDAESQVDLALSLYDEIQLVAKDPAARAAIPSLLEKINLRIWLNFGEGTKGKRKVRVLQGGILTTGDAKPPIRPYGDDDDDDDGDGCSESRGSSGVSPVVVGNLNLPPIESISQTEAVSFTMGNRGDRI